MLPFHLPVHSSLNVFAIPQKALYKECSAIQVNVRRVSYILLYNVPSFFSSPSSRSWRFNFGYRFDYIFITMGRRYHFKSAKNFSYIEFSILSVCIVVSRAEFFEQKVFRHYGKGCFPLEQALKEIRKFKKNIRNIGESIVNMLSIEGPTTIKKISTSVYFNKGFSLYAFVLIITTGYRKHYSFHSISSF